VRLPEHADAVVSREKIADYLLSVAHPDGSSKAVFFRGLGFSGEAWEVFREALLRHAAEHEVTRVETSPFGTRYVVEGVLHAPDGRQPFVRVVWFVDSGSKVPRLVTAYPLRGRAS
jgi:hypothetical protein